jgi:uncharacterized protein YjgD (DUF1641 family)
MAKSTNVIVRPLKTQEERRSGERETLLEGTSDHSDALLEAMALLQSLHERGVLEALTALFQQGNEVLGVAMETLSQPAYGQGARNALTIAQSFAAVDEETMATSQRMVTGGLRGFANAQPPKKPMGVFGLSRALRDPDVSAGLAATLALLKGIGAAQRQRGE